MEILKQNSQNKEKGQSLVETALMFSILLIILAGTVDIGRAYFVLIALRDAATEGAVYGSVFPSETAEIEVRVRGTSNSPVPLSNTSTVTVDISATKTCAGISGASIPNGITVTVTYQFTFAMPLSGLFFPPTTDLSATATHTIISPVCA